MQLEANEKAMNESQEIKQNIKKIIENREDLKHKKSEIVAQKVLAGTF